MLDRENELEARKFLLLAQYFVGLAAGIHADLGGNMDDYFRLTKIEADLGKEADDIPPDPREKPVRQWRINIETE